MAIESSNVGLIPGQMTVDECIEVAATGRDGKPAVPSDNERPRPTRSSVIANVVAKRLRKEQQ